MGPERGLPQRKDPLWLDTAAVHTRPANRPDIPADAVEGIAVFKDKPLSDEEQEQCSRQLSAQVHAALMQSMCSSKQQNFFSVHVSKPYGHMLA